VGKEDVIVTEGQVIEVLPNATFKVVTKENITLNAYMSGRMRQNKIQVLLGDSVQLELSPYDLTKGRISRRL